MKRHVLKYATLIMAICGSSPLFAQVAVDVEIFESATPHDDYLTWAPTKARIRLKVAQPTDVDVVLTNDAPTTFPAGGDLVFSDTAPAVGLTATDDELPLTLKKDRAWTAFFVAGKFGRPSSEDKDAVLEVHQGTATGTMIGTHAMMVRVRKNALSLTDGEKERYLSAIGELRQQNKYRVFADIHAANPFAGNPDAHSGPAFIPWHRVYLLAYERALQDIDASVALPYWKFDEPAQDLFSSDFMGANSVSPSLNPESEPAVNVTFASGNPLFGWTTDLLPIGPIPPASSQPLKRSPADRSLIPSIGPNLIRTQVSTIQPSSYLNFRSIEGNPHGFAHVWGGGMGSLGSIPTAVEDPLFFMLHCNVDRLWAAWQRRIPQALANGRRYEDKINGYAPQSPRKFPATGATIHVGHYADDSMWPWNGVIGTGGNALDQRPTTAPGGPVKVTPPFAPIANPSPVSMLDYQGRLNVNSNQGVGYDDDAFKAD